MLSKFEIHFENHTVSTAEQAAGKIFVFQQPPIGPLHSCCLSVFLLCGGPPCPWLSGPHCTGMCCVDDVMTLHHSHPLIKGGFKDIFI